MRLHFWEAHITTHLCCYYIINTHAHSQSSLFSQKAFLGIIKCSFLYSLAWLLFGSGALLDLLSIKRRNLNYFWSTSDSIHGCCWFIPALLGNQPREAKTLGHMWKLTVTLYFWFILLLPCLWLTFSCIAAHFTHCIVSMMKSYLAFNKCPHLGRALSHL